MRAEPASTETSPDTVESGSYERDFDTAHPILSEVVWGVMHKLIPLALAGALGTLARFGVVGLTARTFGSEFPWGTVAVNLIGCFLFGLVLTLSRERGVIDAGTAQLVLVGFMGAFTTFSSYVADCMGLAAATRLGSVIVNIGLQNVGGFASFAVGAALARLG
jgi:CrcB protein